MNAVPRVADLRAKATGRTKKATPLPRAQRLSVVVRKALTSSTLEGAAALVTAPALDHLRDGHIKPLAVMRAVEEIVSALIEERTSEHTARAVVNTLYRAGKPSSHTQENQASRNRAVLRARDGTPYHGNVSINGLLKSLWAPNDAADRTHLARTNFSRATWAGRARIVEIVEPLFGGSEGLYMPLPRLAPPALSAHSLLPVQCHSLLPVFRALGACDEIEWMQVANHLKERCPLSLQPMPWWFGTDPPTLTHIRRAGAIFDLAHVDKNHTQPCTN